MMKNLKKGLLFTRIGLYAENEQQKDSTLVNYKNDIAIESYHLTRVIGNIGIQ